MNSRILSLVDDAEVLNLSTYCPVCKLANVGDWVIIQVENESKKVCKKCAEKSKSYNFDTKIVARRKELAAQERKKKNDKIIQELKRTSRKK